MAKAVRSLGEIDPARLYAGPTVDAIFAIDPSTRWRWIKRGKLTPHYPGGRHSRPKFSGAEILGLIKASREVA